LFILDKTHTRHVTRKEDPTANEKYEASGPQNEQHVILQTMSIP